ncbi:MAG: ABC transporter substrate-binding protein [Spirochaetales bacterium]|nr:ABC transporter substrate-binding protein [Spirochaetales bacterium]
MKRIIIGLFVFTLLFATGCQQDKPTFKLAWSHYTGWEPWAYAEDAGIIAKWADKFGINIEVVLVNDYIESINLYTAGEFDACTMTNMDGLTIPAVGGVDSTVLIIGDFSNGNDGIVVKNGGSVSDLKGREIKLVQLSVSHYLLARALEMNALTEKDVTLVNTSDADIGTLYLSDTSPTATIVTWNPILMQVRDAPDTTVVFDSSSIPGEIIDLAVVKTDAPESFKKALTGAWYEVMTHMQDGHPKYNEAIEFMAKTAGGTVDEFKAQLKTTAMFYEAAEAVDFNKSAKLKETMEYVRTFSFDHGLYAEAESKDYVGIEFPDGSVLGNQDNVKLRFDVTYMQMAADSKLE